MKPHKQNNIKVDVKGWNKAIQDMESLYKSIPAFKKLIKYTPDKLLSLLERDIEETHKILTLLMMQYRYFVDEKRKTKYQNVIRDSFIRLMHFLTRRATAIKMMHEIKRVNQENCLSLDEAFYWIAKYATRYLMNNGYKYPTKQLREVMKGKLDAPILISPFDSEKDIKIKIEELSSQTGLCQQI